MTQEAEHLPGSSRALARMLDSRRPLDYLWLALFASLPIALAAWIGVLWNVDGFAGYGCRVNWISLVVILPVAVFCLRWIANRIGPVSPPVLPAPPPPVVGLIDTDAGRRTAYAALRRALLAPANLYAALLVTALIHVADMAQLGGVYLSGATQLCGPAPAAEQCASEIEHRAEPTAPVDSGAALGRGPCTGQLRALSTSLSVPFAGTRFEVEKDWSVAYLSPHARVGKGSNLLLNLSAYSVQFATVFVGILLTLLILRHNLFFLSRIYQRRRVVPGEEPSYIHVDLDDDDKCFGFRAANAAFNVQVLALAVAAALILATRFANVGPDSSLFRDAGQWLAVAAWVGALAVASLPILVKLLPRLPLPGVERAPASLVGYLREFLSDRAWAPGRDTPADEINTVAARFAENAFWPTGNNRAWQLYFLSFWVFLIALVPDPRAISGDLGRWSMFAAWAVEGVLAWGATWALFRVLRLLLTYVDSRLVEAPVAATGEAAASRRRRIPIGLFISYRRDDTAAHTGRLYDSLSNHIERERLFMDLDKIPGGANFVDEMKKAIDSAQAMIVVIGPRWLSVTRDGTLPRIQDPADYVHLEIAHGLARGIPVFPVLVGGARMPSAAELPDGLKRLAERNAREISDSRWSHDVGLLLRDLETVPRAGRA